MTEPAERIGALAEMAQHLLREIPVVVLGSGATVSYGLPTTKGLGDAIIAAVKPTEEVERGQWSRVAAAFSATSDLEKALQDNEISENLLRQVTIVAWNEVSARERTLFASLLAQSTTLALTRLFAYLLRTAFSTVSVVTTNYDRVAEYAADQAEAELCCGFSGGHIQRQVDGTPAHRARRVFVWKVHGSLDWFRAASGRVVGVPRADAIPAGFTPLVITPGVRKYRDTHQEPFRSIMSSADGALRAAKCYLCVGYGFNDEHVQPVMMQRAKDAGIPIVVLARTLTPAARAALLNASGMRYMALERSGDDTRVYHAGMPGGEIVVGQSLWSLDTFFTRFLDAGASA